MIRRLKIKFICINMLIVTVMLAMIFGMVLYVTSRNVAGQGSRMLQSIHDGPRETGNMGPEPRVPYFVVMVSPKGVYSVSSENYFLHSSEQELLKIAQNVHEGEASQGFLREHNLRFSRRPSGVGEKIVFLDVSVERSMILDLLRTCGILAAVSYLLFFGISVLLAQWAVHPVADAWNRQQEFVADASHELKTPLTVILTNAELLQEPGFDEVSRSQFVQSIQTMSRQMQGLVEGLLSLARLDNGVVKTEFQKVDISNLAESCLLPFEPLFFEKGMELVSQMEPDIFVNGSASHLHQVMDILLDNAGKYAGAGSAVHVTLKRQGGTCLFTVANSGDPISGADLKNIFRRFYRIDKARSMNQSYGLGLSIAESILRQHRGKIWAESAGGINSFHVQLPVAA